MNICVEVEGLSSEAQQLFNLYKQSSGSGADCLKGSAGSLILSCLICGANHFRDSMNGQGIPSWCIDCCWAHRSQRSDGRVIPVMKADLVLWKSLWSKLDRQLKTNKGEVK